MSKRPLVPVTERAVVQRLNRAMGKQGLKLKKAPSARAETRVSEWSIIDIAGNYVVQKDADLAALAKNWAVLAAGETIAEKAV